MKSLRLEVKKVRKDGKVLCECPHCGHHMKVEKMKTTHLGRCQAIIDPAHRNALVVIVDPDAPAVFAPIKSKNRGSVPVIVVEKRAKTNDDTPTRKHRDGGGCFRQSRRR